MAMVKVTILGCEHLFQIQGYILEQILIYIFGDDEGLVKTYEKGEYPIICMGTDATKKKMKS